MAEVEIAHYEQFLLLPHCFQKSSAAEASESVYIWERVIFKIMRVLSTHKIKILEALKLMVFQI